VCLSEFRWWHGALTRHAPPRLCAALTEFVTLGTKVPKAHVTIQSGFPLEGEVLEASTHVVWCTTKKGSGAWTWHRLREGEAESAVERIEVSSPWVTLRARLGDAKSSLGDAKSSLGDAKSSLGDAKSPPHTRQGAISSTYMLMLADVGCSVSALYTPRSGEGIMGVPGQQTTPAVEAHSPICQVCSPQRDRT
jgi:hypothetical protein